jgi:hypothetical protein
LRYEELVKDPVGEMESLYEALQLDGFDRARPRVEDYLRQTDGYETNKYALSAEDRREIEERCGEVIRRFGYELGRRAATDDTDETRIKTKIGTR